MCGWEDGGGGVFEKNVTYCPCARKFLTLDGISGQQGIYTIAARGPSQVLARACRPGRRSTETCVTSVTASDEPTFACVTTCCSSGDSGGSTRGAGHAARLSESGRGVVTRTSYTCTRPRKPLQRATTTRAVGVAVSTSEARSVCGTAPLIEIGAVAFWLLPSLYVAWRQGYFAGK